MLLKSRADFHDTSHRRLAIIGHLTFVIKSRRILKARVLYKMEKEQHGGWEECLKFSDRK